MANLEKKKVKLKERIEQLESELKNTLHKKSVGTAISVSDYTSKIMELKKQLATMEK